MTTATLSQVVKLPPNETIAFFKAKGARILTENWWELWQEEHVRAFTVAKVNDLDVLNIIYAEKERIIAEGGTLESFKKALRPQLEQAVAEGKAPENILSDKRLKTIYQTNLRMARAAGQWQRIDKLKSVAPYLVYFAVKDDHTRAEHRLWGGVDSGKPIVLPVDHPFWFWFFPPNGWGCRCNVIQMSARELEAAGYAITTDAELASMGLPISSSAPDDLSGVRTREYVRGDGAIEDVPVGVDPGFAYNVGREHLRGLGDALVKSLDAMANNNVAIAQSVLQQVLDQTGFDVLLGAPGSSFPVMVLDTAKRDLIGAQTAVARLSADTFAKQRRSDKHPELGLDAYRKLVEMGAKPDIILKQGELRIILIKAEAGKWLKATVKVTQDGNELYVVNYQYARPQEITRLKRLNEIVYERG